MLGALVSLHAQGWIVTELRASTAVLQWHSACSVNIVVVQVAGSIWMGRRGWRWEVGKFPSMVVVVVVVVVIVVVVSR